MSRESFPNHLRDLDRLLALDPERVLPSHGDPEAIAAGGYGPAAAPRHPGLHPAPAALPAEPELRELPLRELLAPCARGRLDPLLRAL